MASKFGYVGPVSVRVLIIVLFFAGLIYFGIGCAHAQTYASQGEALQACDAAVNASRTQCFSSTYDHGSHGHGSNTFSGACQRVTGDLRYHIPVGTGCYNGTHGFLFGPSGSYYWTTSCPAGEEPDSGNGYACVNPTERCLNKNDSVPSSSTAIYTGQQCNDGCVYGKRSGGGDADSGGGVIGYGSLGYTGETCTATSVPPTFNDGPTCTPAGSGQTFCVKPNGDHCYSASTGRQICWGPGETGTKTDGPVAQTRNPGTDNPAPPPTPPAGETLSPPSPNTNTTTNQPGGTVTNTTVNNYTTNNGTNGGPTNSGEPNDGSSGDGEEEGEGTASGGEGCEVPPVCGGDPIGCATLQQVWRTRCADNGNKITGGAECDANGNPVFVCSGDEVLCKTAETQARAYCLAQKADGNGDGQPDWTEGDGPVAPGNDGEDGTVGTGTVGVSTDMLDQENIFGSGSCPVFSVTIYGQTMTSASIPEWCDIVAIMRAVVLLMGAFAAVRILMGE